MRLKWGMGVVIGLLLILLLNVNSKVRKWEDKANRAFQNLTELNTENSNLKFRKEELQNYLKFLDNAHKIEVDSILKLHNVKVKNLIRFTNVTIQKLDLDTSVNYFTSVTKLDSTYKIQFKNERKCQTIFGYILSKDSTTSGFITKVDGINRVYITKSYKKTFWDKIFFRKGKEFDIITSDCDSVTIDEIGIN